MTYTFSPRPPSVQLIYGSQGRCCEMQITCGSIGSCAAYEGAALLVLPFFPLLADADCSGPNESMVIIFDEERVSVT